MITVTTGTTTLTTATSTAVTTQSTLTTTLTTLTTGTTTTICFSAGCDGRILIGGSLDDLIEGFSAIAPTSDGGLVLTGYSTSSDGDMSGQGANGISDIVVIKLTATGAFDASFDTDGIKLIGGSANDNGYSVIQSADGGYVLIGTTLSTDGDMSGQGSNGSNDIVVIKLTAVGVFDTGFDGDGIRLIGGTGNDIGTSVNQCADGSLVLTGYSDSSDGDMTGQGAHGFNDMVVIKLTATGAFDPGFDGDGIKLIGGTGSDSGFSIIQSADGGFILTGFSSSSNGDMLGQGAHGSFDILVVKLTAAGTFDASFDSDGIKLIGGSGVDFGTSIIQSDDGGYVLTSYSTSSNGDMTSQGAHGNNDIAIVKLLADGSFDMNFDFDGIKLIGGTGDDYGTSVIQSDDGGLLLTGYSNSSDGNMTGQGAHGLDDIVVIKLSSTGTFDTGFDGDGIRLIGGTGEDWGYTIIHSADGAYVLTGISTSSDGDMEGQEAQGDLDIAVVKLWEHGGF